MQFDYYYARDGDQFRYIQLPIVLLEDEVFSKMSLESIVLYSMMLNRISLSFKNGWVDDQERIYIYFTVEEVMSKLRCKTDKAVRIMAELDGVKGLGLIERKRQGLGKPSIIYVKDFMSIFRSQDFGKTERQTSEKPSSEPRNNRSQDHGKTEGNYIEFRKPELSKNDKRSTSTRLGLFKNVILTQVDYEELTKTIMEDLDGLIDRLSAYMKSTGRTYKNHKATLMSWYLQDKQKHKKKSTGVSYEDYDKGDYL